MNRTHDDRKSVAESDVTTVSEVSVPEDVLEMCKKYDFDSDGTTISDVDGDDDANFSQWSESMDALVASFDLTQDNPKADITAGVDASQKSNETVSMVESPVTSPQWSRAKILTGNTTSPSAAKRHLEMTFDTYQGPPISRHKHVMNDASGNAQSELSPLRKTLMSTLSLRKS